MDIRIIDNERKNVVLPHRGRNPESANTVSKLRIPVQSSSQLYKIKEEKNTTILEQLLKGHFPGQYLPVINLRIDPARFQFKAGVTEEGVIPEEQLQGEYIELGTGTIIVWVEDNGDSWVVDGHHRFDFAIRTGKSFIPSQVIREIEGFTEQDAITIGAISNILNGTGNEEDYARFFKGFDLSEEDAVRWGVLSRKKGKNGWAIAKYASEDLYAWYLSQLDDEAKKVAVLLAQAAPCDNHLQREGQDWYLNEKITPQEMVIRIKYVQHRAGHDKECDQFYLPGFEEGEIKGKLLTRAAAELASEYHHLKCVLRQAITKRGSLVLTEAEASNLGITDRDNVGQLKRALEEVEGKINKYENFWIDDEVRLEVFENAGLRVIEPSDYDNQDSYKREPQSGINNENYTGNDSHETQSAICIYIDGFNTEKGT